MRSASEARAILAGNMKSALDDDELFLLFQPRMDARSGKVRGFEALLRWRHPEHGVMLPAAFLAEAEESGLIVDIGNRVLDRACAFARELRHAGYTALPVAVNVSHREYSRPTFIAGIAERMSRYGLPPGTLEIEIPEADLIRNPGLGRDLAAQLRDVGAMLSIDQFGRGISDLNFLQQLSVLVIIALIMTVGVYGLVAGIVKMDDAGLYLSQRPGGAAQALGRGLLATAPRLMKILSVVGTAAMFMVGGGIIAHAIEAVHHFSQGIAASLTDIPAVGPVLAFLAPILVDALVGVLVGAVVLGVVTLVQRMRGKKAAAH